MWYEGLLGWNVWQILLYTLILTHVTIVSVTVFLHRSSAHRALELHPVLQHFFRFWLWLTTGMVTKEWTAIHRKHHATCETEDDPHSPQILGLRKVMLEGAELYRTASADKEMLEKFGKGTPDDWLERHVYGHVYGVSLMLIVNLALFGPLGAAVWAVQMMWIPVLAAGVINGVGHYAGYRNFEVPDASTNIVPWGILIGGEELHNNHHTYPNSAKLSVKPWEFDVGWMWIRLFAALGLVKVVSTGPVVERVPHKSHIDIDTVWAVLNDRFQVMSRYAEEVVAPLVEQERLRADAATKRLLKRAKNLLCRDESVMDAKGVARREQLLAELPLMHQIYDLRMKLQGVWKKRGGNREELLAAFIEWCREAEESGIQVLRDFVEELKSYGIPGRAATA